RTARLLQAVQKLINISGLMFQRAVDGDAQRLPVGGLGGIAQPLVVALAVGFGILHNGVAVLNANGVAEPPNRSAAAQKIAELAVAVEVHSVPNDVIMNVSPVNVGADDESVIAFGETLCQLLPQAVGLLRRDLARHKGLPQVISDDVILPAYPAG